MPFYFAYVWHPPMVLLQFRLEVKNPWENKL
jgi:hypothetical protein